MPVGQPLELILARNLIATVTVPGFVTDSDGAIVFYNEAAGELLGRRFEERGRLSRDQWEAIGPLDERGEPLESEAPLTRALRNNRPSHGRFRICTDDSELVMVDTSAVPLFGPTGFVGAIVVFWPSEDA